MSQTYCPGNAEIYTGVNRPQGNGGPFENTRSDANPILENMSGLREQGDAIARQEMAVQQVSASIDQDVLPSTPLTRRDSSQITSLSRELVNLVERAGEGQARQRAAWEEAYNKVSGTTVGETTKWLDFINGVAKRFLDKNADFRKWAQLHFAENDRSVVNNTLVQAFDAVEPRTRGHLQKYTNQLNDLSSQVEPIARRIGYDTKDLLDAAGHYANARHAEERNAFLISRWEADLADQRSRGARGDQAEVTRLETQIAELRQHLDNPNPPEDLTSSGYTNGEARALMDQFIRDTGVTRAEADFMADGLQGVYRQVLQDRIDAGFVAPEVVASFPEFQNFLPYKTKYENTTGALNNSDVYNPGRYYAIQGAQNRPDSAYHTVMHFARRASNEIGMQELGTTLTAAIRRAEEQGRDIGIRQYDYAKLMQAKHGNNEYRRAWANNIENSNNGGGLVVDVPIYDAEGNFARTRRMFLTFDSTWTDPRSGLSGADLNQAMTGTTKTAVGFNRAAQATSLYGRLFTQFNPAFAPVNTIRDFVERSTHIINRDYYLDNGSSVSGASLLGRYFLNAPKSGKFVFEALSGRLDPSSPGARLWAEYVEQGLHQEYTRGVNTPRRTLAEIIEGRNQPQGFIESKLNDPGFAGVKQRLDQLGRGRDQVMSVLNGWNDYFNNIASFNHYLTLREAGVNANNAARGTIELFNLYQSGTWTPILQSLFPFVRPTVQTIAASARTFGVAPDGRGQFRTSAKGVAGLLGTYAGYMALLPLLKEGLGVDEETGLNRFDQLGISELQRFVPIGLGDGNFAKMPTGFGPIQLAITLAVGTDRVQRGLMAPEDFVAETLYVVGKNVSPQNWPEFSFRAKPLEWLTQAFTPTLAAPIVNLATNTNYMGNPITNARSDGFRARSDQGYLSTQKEYHQLAKGIYSATGIDLAPEQVKSLVGNIAVGPLRLIKGLVEQDSVIKRGTTESAAETMGPWLSAMGGSLLYGKAYENGRAMYYKALNQYRERIRREGIKVTDRSYGSNTDKAEAFQRNALRKAGWGSDDINDFILLQQTERQLRSQDTKFAQDIRPVWLSSDDSGPVRREFERLAREKAALYNNVVTRLGYYRGA